MKFHATSAETFEDLDSGVITIHFDSGEDAYVQFQGALPGFEEDYYDGGYVYMEVNGQALSGYDCFEKVVVRRKGALIHGITNERIQEVATAIEVTFDVDDATHAAIENALRKSFRDCPEKLISDTGQSTLPER